MASFRDMARNQMKTMVKEEGLDMARKMMIKGIDADSTGPNLSNRAKNIAVRG